MSDVNTHKVGESPEFTAPEWGVTEGEKPLQTEKRIVTFTEKGEEMFVTVHESYVVDLDKAWSKIEDIFVSITEGPKDIASLRVLENELCKCRDKLFALSDDYVSFLSRTNARGSGLEAELERHISKRDKYKKVIQSALVELDEFKLQAMENFSMRGSATIKLRKSNSVTSNISSTVALRAKADAQRARVKYAKQELVLRKQQAAIIEQESKFKATSERQKTNVDADLQLLAVEKEAAVAEAEVQVLESVDSDSRGSLADVDLDKPVDRSEFTKQYVNEQHAMNKHATKGPSNDNTGYAFSHADNIDRDIPTPRAPPESLLTPQKAPDQSNPLLTHRSVPSLSLLSVKDDRDIIKGSRLNLDAPVYNPVSRNVECPRETQHPPAGTNQTVLSDFSRFLLKKDLLLSRLSRYNDHPESYATWKTSFQRIMNELQVTPYEELDLLVKWLGPDSTKHALSIRASNVHNPERGLERVWARLEERYGCPEMVESALKMKLVNFPKLTNRDSRKLYELADIVSEIESAKEDPKFISLLAYYDSSSGVLPIVNKLPYGIQEKWTTRASNFKKHYNVAFPPFSIFAEFIREISKIRNDPSFLYDNSSSSVTTVKGERAPVKHCNRPTSVSARKLDVDQRVEQRSEKPKFDINKRCPLHKTLHTLQNCVDFRRKPLHERRKVLSACDICFRCCASTDHIARLCKSTIRCNDCGSDKHVTVMHLNSSGSGSSVQPSKNDPLTPSKGHGGEQDKTSSSSEEVKSSCTTICGNEFTGESCAKTVLVNVYPKDEPHKSFKTYALLDDQSNRTLADPTLFDVFGINTPQEEYVLSSCSGKTVTSGRRAVGLVVESLDSNVTFNLPTLIECGEIPDNRDEIPTPSVAEHHPHLLDIASHIPALDNDASILLLIGRDLTEAHHVLDQRIGPRSSPYAQKLPLGWVIVGETCLNKVHQPELVSVHKTHFLGNGRSSIFKPCPNEFSVRETYNNPLSHVDQSQIGLSTKDVSDLSSVLFERNKNDNKVGTSVHDREFLRIMDKSFEKDSEGSWVAPLPFRSPRPRLPNNKLQAIKRARMLDLSLQKNPSKKEHFVKFMQQVLDRKHAEVAPSLADNEECWYLPLFGVYHPKKPHQIRGVFDSSAQFAGISLNNVLLTGPDMTNNLLGILIRFRKYRRYNSGHRTHVLLFRRS